MNLSLNIKNTMENYPIMNKLKKNYKKNIPISSSTP